MKRVRFLLSAVFRVHGGTSHGANVCGIAEFSLPVQEDTTKHLLASKSLEELNDQITDSLESIIENIIKTRHGSTLELISHSLTTVSL